MTDNSEIICHFENFCLKSTVRDTLVICCFLSVSTTVIFCTKFARLSRVTRNFLYLSSLLEFGLCLLGCYVLERKQAEIFIIHFYKIVISTKFLVCIRLQNMIMININHDHAL